MPVRNYIFILALSCLIGLSMGCAKDRLLFATKSVVGLDIDSQPPASELSINRKEGVMEPVFEGGQTPPVLASFKADMNPLARFFGYGIGSTFATGDAAEALSSLFSTTDKEFKEEVSKQCKYPTNGQEERSAQSNPATSRDEEEEGSAESPPATPRNGEKNGCRFFKDKRDLLADQFGSYIALTKPPKGNFIDPSDTALLVFATDSVVGLKIDWLNGAYPSGVKFGFNRKEVTWAPLARCKTSANQSAGCFYGVSQEVAKKRERTILTQVGAALTDKLSTERLATSNEDPTKIRQEAGEQAAKDAPTQEVHIIIAPSVLATLDSTYSLEMQRTSGLRYQQYFATGRAATNLATHQQVRRTLMPEFEDSMVAEMEEVYLWAGNRLVSKLGGLSDETRNRVYAFAVTWKFIDAINGNTNPNKDDVVKAMGEKMTSTQKCLAQDDRSGGECAKHRATAHVSKQDMSVVRDLILLCEN